MSISLDRVVTRSDDALGAELHGETVLMSVAEGSYFGLTRTSRDIWQRLEHPIGVRQLCEDLAREYDAPFSVIEADTLAFFDHLNAKGLIKIVDRP